MGDCIKGRKYTAFATRLPFDEWGAARAEEILAFATRPFILHFCTLFLLAVFLLIGCGKTPAPPGVIHSVVFHDVSPTHLHGPCVSPDYFRDVLRMIQLGGKTTVQASEILSFLDRQAIPSDKMVALTFDDGWPGIIDYADSLLEQFEMKAILFAATDSIEQGRPRYCSWDDLKQLRATGRWEIHSHSVTHADFINQDDSSLRSEMENSLAQLREHGFVHSNLIAYPFGHSDERIEKMARLCGYQAGFIAGGNARIETNSDRYALPRTTICQLFNQDLVCRKIGLDLKAIRRDLAIYDEGEGLWNDSSTQIKSDPGIPRGFYGDSYLVAKDAGAQWTLNLAIEASGTYEVSLWTPVETEGGAVETERTGFWQILSKDGQILERNDINNREKNGWTVLGQLNFSPGTVVITLSPNSGSLQAFLVDALKIERIAIQ